MDKDVEERLEGKGAKKGGVTGEAGGKDGQEPIFESVNEQI